MLENRIASVQPTAIREVFEIGDKIAFNYTYSNPDTRRYGTVDRVDYRGLATLITVMMAPLNPTGYNSRPTYKCFYTDGIIDLNRLG
jgi:hypothetical protein